MRGCLALVLFVLFVAPLLCAFQMLAAASTFAVNRDFYTSVLAEPQLYGVFLDAALAEAGGTAEPLQATGEYEQVIATLNTAEWRAMVASGVNQIFDVLEGKTDQVTLAIPLAPLKAVLQSGAATPFISRYIDGLPDCRGGQEPTAAPPQFANVPLPICVPQNRTRAAYIEQYISTLPQTVAAMPEYLTYSDTVEFDAGFEEFQQVGGFTSLQTILQGGVIVFGVIAVGAWFITGLIAAGRPRGQALALGSMLLVASLPVLFIGIILYGVFSAPNMATLQLDTTDTSAITQAVYDSLSTSPTIKTAFLAAGGIPSAIGVALLLLGLILPQRRDDEMLADLRGNPTTHFGGAPGAYPGFGKPKNDDFGDDKPKPKNDDDIIRPL